MSNTTQNTATATTGVAKKTNGFKKLTGVSAPRYIAITGVLSAIAVILMYLEFPIPIMPFFIKYDFSDLPALLGSFALGPVCGIIICLIKNLIHLAVSQSGFVGELSNFLLGSIFVGIAGVIYKFKKTRTMAVVGAIVGAVAMGFIGVITNYFVVYPIYTAFMPMETIIAAYDAISYDLLGGLTGGHVKFHVDTLLECLFYFNVPFTILKGLVATAIAVPVYKPLSHLFKK